MNERQRETAAALAELLVPAGSGMPSAREAGAGEAGLDRVLVALPELAAPLGALLDRASGRDPAEALAELREDAEAFSLLALLAAGAYLTEPEVLERLGYRGRPATPLGDDLDDGVVDLLEAVLARGGKYRPA